MAKTKYPPRHTKLMTPSGPAHFEAKSTGGKILVYHVRKEYKKKEWDARFGENSGKGVMLFYDWRECSLYNEEGELEKEVTKIPVPKKKPTKKKEPKPIPNNRIGQIWTSKRAGIDYEIIFVDDHEVTFQEVGLPSYKRKVKLVKLEKYYDRKT